jgi:hypothetical protein
MFSARAGPTTTSSNTVRFSAARRQAVEPVARRNAVFKFFLYPSMLMIVVVVV